MLSFQIDGASFSGTWDTADAATNDVTITFNENGENESAFNIDISDCSGAEFAVTSGGGAGGSSADAVVTFTNQMAITTATACLDVTLYVDGISAAVATRRVEYDITAPQSGTDGTVQVVQGNLAGVGANPQALQSNTASGAHSLVFSPTIVTAGTIKYGDTFDVELDAIAGYEIDVSAVSVGAILDEKNGVGFVAAPTKKSITIKLPLSSFLDANGGSETIDLTVDWQVIARRRHLRVEGNDMPSNPLHGKDPLPGQEDNGQNVEADSGKSQARMVVELVPLSGLEGIGEVGESTEFIKGAKNSAGFIVRYYIPATAVLAASTGVVFI